MYIGSQKLMKKYDECLLEEGYSIEELVDKASDCLMKHMQYQNVVIFCGPGNNGADGLSLAYKLHCSYKTVHVFIFDHGKRLSQANRYYLQLCEDEKMNIQVVEENLLEDMKNVMVNSDVIIDAMFGFGLNSSPRGLYAMVIEEINQLYDHEVIAVDIPTGLNCNTGTPYQNVVCATKTITLSAIKDGFLNPDSQLFTGQVFLEHLDAKDMSEKAGLYQIYGNKNASDDFKHRHFHGHKGTYGRVACVCGSDDYKGAALLSGKSSVYSGSGITTVISNREVLNALSLFCPEATQSLRPAVFQEQDFEKYQAILIGCGLGLDIDAYRYVHDVLTLTHQPLVIDADALTILSTCQDLLLSQKRPIILTPHLGEFKRLCDIQDNDDMLTIAKNYAFEHHVILVLKGPLTIVTDGQEGYRVNAGDKAMAAGGMGDVLSGIIVSLLAQGYDALKAALLGVYIHGYTGEKIAELAYTVIPSQLIERLPLSMYEIAHKKNNHKGLFF